jgi:hypothetical protein
VDNQNKCVFNGSDLGKSYSAAALQSRLTNINETSIKHDEANNNNSSGSLPKEIGPQKQQEKTIAATFKREGLLDMLLSAKEQNDNTPSGLLKKKRKKKKKNRDL